MALVNKEIISIRTRLMNKQPSVTLMYKLVDSFYIMCYIQSFKNGIQLRVNFSLIYNAIDFIFTFNYQYDSA